MVLKCNICKQKAPKNKNKKNQANMKQTNSPHQTGSLEAVTSLRLLEASTVITSTSVSLSVNWYCYKVIKDNNRRNGRL